MMMLSVLASGPIPTLEQVLAPWAQVAAIILVIELFFFVLIWLALNVGFTFLSGWVREKAELIKRLRPVINSVNSTTEAAIKGTLPPAGANDNKIVRTVAEIPARASSIEGKINQASDRVAGAVIEFRARTAMVQGIAKSFFLPGLNRPASRVPAIKSPGLKMLLEEHSPEVTVKTQDGNVDLAAPEVAATTVSSAQLKEPSRDEAQAIASAQVKDAPVD
jgi:hypothetical protein